jgi:hypothetical protein
MSRKLDEEAKELNMKIKELKNISKYLDINNTSYSNNNNNNNNF